MAEDATTMRTQVLSVSRLAESESSREAILQNLVPTKAVKEEEPYDVLETLGLTNIKVEETFEERKSAVMQGGDQLQLQFHLSGSRGKQRLGEWSAGGPSNANALSPNASADGNLPPPYDKVASLEDSMAQLSLVQQSGPVNVWVHGACPSNGQKGRARAGVGVWWGEGDPRNVSEPLDGKSTNNRAALQAIYRALETAGPGVRKLHVYSNSEYAIKCFTEWIKRWRANGWRTAKGEPVLNLDLIQKIWGRMQAPGAPKVEFIESRRTENAVRLANAGAALPLVILAN
ncbi:ribonuclease H-like protein [Gonapodya prolifera JEL478]|uniref:ribonuclease H n=1 Tax=Gonapodya prolifera (strain JEL478) TaxID=1344416 RepID=A0A138ZZ66_GONPJ|nr:ribonuclease H-like protein [Gonapodya prolifera JEL478]|eukprot:KXS09423.1 ribonuclease H-like protein [Gonapodya prolifera JEL478]